MSDTEKRTLSPVSGNTNNEKEKAMKIETIREILKDSKTISEFISKLADKQWETGVDEIGVQAYRVKELERDVIGYVTWVEKKAREVRERVTRELQRNGDPLYTGLNSSGELQGNGVGFDIAIARYCDAFDRLRSMINDVRVADEKEKKALAFAQLLKDEGINAVVQALRSQNRQTAKQLAHKIKATEDDIKYAVTTLGAAGFCKTIGTKIVNYYLENDPENDPEK